MQNPQLQILGQRMEGTLEGPRRPGAWLSAQA